MTRLVILGVFVFSANLSSGQVVFKRGPLPDVKDTVYIGVSNALKLEKPFAEPTYAKSSNGSVRVEGNKIIIHPVHVGKTEIILHCKDTVLTRSFITTYLPKPAKVM